MNRKLIVTASLILLLVAGLVIFLPENNTPESDRVENELHQADQFAIDDQDSESSSESESDISQQIVLENSKSPDSDSPLLHSLGEDRFTGFVRDSSADELRPLSGAVVRAIWFSTDVYSNAETEPQILAETISEDNGSFEFHYIDVPEDGTLAYRAEYPGYSSLIKIFPNGDGVDNLALTTFMMLKADTIEGIVVDQNDEPVVNAHVGEIVLEDSVGGKITATPGTYVSSWDRTDSSGRFRLTGIPLPDRDPQRPRAAREFQIPAVAANHSKGLSERVVAGSEDVTIRLFKSEGSLFGTVYTHDQKTVPGAVVKMIPEQETLKQNRPGKLETVTETDGTFSFPDLLAGRYVLTTTVQEPTALGFDPVVYRQVVIVKGSSQSEQIYLPAPVQISGRVTDEESNPVADFTFHTNIDEAVRRSQAPTVVTDDSGEFKLEFYVPQFAGDTGFSPRMPVTIPEPFLPAGQDANAGYRLTGTDIVFQGLKPGEILQNLEVVVQEGSVIEGIVFESDSITIAGNTSVFYRGSQTFGSVMTDDEGHFRFLAAENEEVTVEASTELGIAAETVTAPEENADLIMEEYAEISGRVETAEGVAMPNYEVRINRIEKPGGIKDAVRFEEFSITDEQGNYQIVNVAPDELELNLLIPFRTEHIAPKAIVLAPSPGEVMENINFTLEEGDYIEGYVYNEKSEPLDEVSINTNNSRLSASTDENGYFRITGTPRDETLSFLSAAREGYQEKKLRNVTIYDGVIEIELSKLEAVELIAQSSGSPVQNYRLLLENKVRTPAGWEYQTVREKIATSSDGKTVLPDLQDGEYRAEAIALDSGGQETQQRGASEFRIEQSQNERQTVIIEMTSGLYLQGVVVMGEVPSPNATVEIRGLSESSTIEGVTYDGPPWDRKAITIADANGSFLVGPVSPNSYLLRAENNDAVSDWKESVIVNSSEEIILELFDAPVLAGSIILPEEDSGKSSTILFSKGNAAPSGQPLLAEEPSFEQMLDSTGQWRVIVSINGTPKSMTQVVDVTSGERKEVTFDFNQQVKLSGTLHINGQPANRSNIVLRNPAGNEAYLRLTSEGIYETVLEPGQYQPWILTGDLEAPAGGGFIIPEGTESFEQPISLQLARVDLLIGEQVDFSGGKLELILNNQSGTHAVTTDFHIDRNGFRFVDVPEGEYKATVILQNQTTLVSDWTPVSSNHENSLVLFSGGG